MRQADLGLAIQQLGGARSPFPLWLVDASHPPAPDVEALLSREERTRAGRFHDPALRDRYVAAHGALRLVLEQCFGIPAGRQSFGQGPFGKPYLDGMPQAQFSVSYSGQNVLIGAAADIPIGVDIERLRPVDGAVDLARSFGTAAERAALERCRSGSARFDRMFLEIWTRKEACVKAAGIGIAEMDLAGIESGAGGGLKTVRVGFCQLRTDTTLIDGVLIAAWAAGNVPVTY